MLRGRKVPWDLVIFVASISALAFLYGVVVTQFRLFPYPLIKSAGRAANALRELYLERQNTVHRIQSEDGRGGVTTYDPDRAYNGLTLLTLFSGERNVAVVVDMSGRELHRWDVRYSAVLGEKDQSVRDVNKYLNSAHVFPNGEILLNFDYGGLVKLDRASNVLWKLDEQTHHSIFVDTDGAIWVPTRQLRKKPQAFAAWIESPYFDDQLLKVAPDGKVMKRISVLKAIFASRYEGILYANASLNPRVDYEDPLHLNDAELIPGSAAGHPLFAPGDVLLSLRNINTLIALDPASERIKWSRTGPFLRQHDPDFLPNGNLLVFDNRTDTDQHHKVQHLTEPQAFGYSRVIEIEPVTGRVIWEFAGSREKPFYSSINGMAERLPNGNHLIVEPEAGRVFEIDGTAEPQVVWEYRNSLGTDPATVGRIAYAHRLEAGALTFLSTPVN
ncbi:MAG: arylsulfotransferase family protein [Gammaproteobacteria bacterium]